MKSSYLPIAALFVPVFLSSYAATYYVSPTGSASKLGARAANIVNPGDTVVVRDGIAQASHTGLVVSFQWWSEFWKSRIQR